MNRKNAILTGALSLSFLAGAIGFAQSVPTDHVRGGRHENIAAAQQLIKQAYAKIEAAQRANKDQLGDHAQKAEQLLDQASRELGMAADSANQDHRK